ncbi:MAG TPA: methionyl-tRNA formyltransferase [Candidatus Didemnitutus sp.]|nr:methionyl-tRNA formyltransferase [Candidatus Didemnitutus sp.]
MLKIVFMGSDAIALPLLDWLVSEGRVLGQLVAVYTQPDRAAGRGQKVQANAIKTWAQAHSLPVHQPEKLTPDELATLKSYAPDVSLVMAYGHILRQNFIDAPRLGTLNLHASLLPKYRGASPIQTAVANGDKETGVTLMRIVLELDAGPMADTERVPVAPLDTALEIEAKVSRACAPLLARALPRLAAGTLHFAEQEHAMATFCRKLEKNDGALDFTAPAAALAARINGLMPWPGCAVEVNSQPVKFGLADVAPVDVADNLKIKSGEPGTILGSDSEGLLIATGAGVLRARKLQRPGGKMLPAGEFLRGFPLAAGVVLPSTSMTALVAREPFPRPKF